MRNREAKDFDVVLLLKIPRRVCLVSGSDRDDVIIIVGEVSTVDGDIQI